MLRASAGLIALLSTPLTDLPSRPVCRDAPDCNVAGTRALGSGQMAAAEAAFEAQARFAWSPMCGYQGTRALRWAARRTWIR